MLLIKSLQKLNTKIYGNYQNSVFITNHCSKHIFCFRLFSLVGEAKKIKWVQMQKEPNQSACGKECTEKNKAVETSAVPTFLFHSFHFAHYILYVRWESKKKVRPGSIETEWGQLYSTCSLLSPHKSIHTHFSLSK